MINYDKEQTGSKGLLCVGFITIKGSIKWGWVTSLSKREIDIGECIYVCVLV